MLIDTPLTHPHSQSRSDTTPLSNCTEESPCPPFQIALRYDPNHKLRQRISLSYPLPITLRPDPNLKLHKRIPLVFLVSDAFNDITSQAHGHGLLLGAEIDEQLHAAARVESKRQSDSLRSRQNEQKRHSDALIAQPPTATELRRAALFLDNAPVPQGWQAAMIRSEARVVGSLYDANLAISANPFSPSDEVLLHAVLTGV